MTTGMWKLTAYGVVGFVLAALLAAEAARRGAFKRALASVLLGWVLPGAGHLCLGRVRKGFVLFLLVGGTYGAGFVMTGGRVVTFDENPFYYVGQVGSGLMLGLQAWLAAEGGPPRNLASLPLVDPGLLYMAVAGLLNLLLVLNLFDLLEGDRAGAGGGGGKETGAC